jgi:hypothetical protein
MSYGYVSTETHALHSATVWVGGRKSSSDPNTAVRLGWSWQVYSERGCLFCHGLSRFPVLFRPGSQFVSRKLYSDSWTSPLEEIGPGLTKLKTQTENSN